MGTTATFSLLLQGQWNASGKSAGLISAAGLGGVLRQYRAGDDAGHLGPPGRCPGELRVFVNQMCTRSGFTSRAHSPSRSCGDRAAPHRARKAGLLHTHARRVLLLPLGRLALGHRGRVTAGRSSGCTCRIPRSSGRPTVPGARPTTSTRNWAGIGTDRAAIDELVADPRLDVVRADPTRTCRTTSSPNHHL